MREKGKIPLQNYVSSYIAPINSFYKNHRFALLFVMETRKMAVVFAQTDIRRPLIRSECAKRISSLFLVLTFGIIKAILPKMKYMFIIDLFVGFINKFHEKKL